MSRPADQVRRTNEKRRQKYAQDAEYRTAKIEASLAYQRRAAAAGDLRARRHHTTLAVLTAVYEDQGRRCIGCLRAMPLSELRVDHNHACCPGQWSCGRCVCGLLCNGCNSAIGWAHESVEALRRLAAYVAVTRRAA